MAKTKVITPAYAKNSPVWQMAEMPENQGFTTHLRKNLLDLAHVIQNENAEAEPHQEFVSG